MSPADLVLLAIAIPFAGAGAIALFHSHPNLRETATLTAAVAAFAVVLMILSELLAGPRLSTPGLEIIPQLTIAFEVEPLGMIFGLVASGLWIVNSIYSIGYMRGNSEPRQTSFYVCFAVAIASALMVAFAANMFTLFLGYEILTLSTYPLVTHKASEDAKRAGRLYLMLLLGTSTMLLLPAIIWTAFLAGTLDFTPGGILAGNATPAVMGILLFMYMYGIGKAALMPIHFWLPAAMVAPTPVSALLHAVAVVKAGVFTVVKVIVYIFGVDALAAAGTGWWLVWLAGFTIIAASFVALTRDDLKARLAYSTVSQLSYVVLAAAILTPISVTGAALHIAVHAVSKITLFFCAGAVYTAGHITKVSQMQGIGRTMPWTMGAFAIASLSMIGVPPTAGFISKWFMLQGAMDAQSWVAVGVIILSTILNTAYFMPIVVSAFFKPAPEKVPARAGWHVPEHEAPWPMVLALTVTAAGTLALFFFPEIPLTLARMMTGAQ